jgi:hypothetical protein
MEKSQTQKQINFSKEWKELLDNLADSEKNYPYEARIFFKSIGRGISL